MTEEEMKMMMPPIKHENIFSYPFSKMKEKSDARAIAAGATFLLLSSTTIANLSAPIVALLAGVGQASLGFDFSASSEVWWIVLLLAASSITSSAIILQSHFDLRKKLSSHDMLKDFTIRQCVNICKVMRRDHIVYSHRYLVRSKKDGARVLKIGYTYTGDSDLVVKLKDPSHSFELKQSRGKKILSIDVGRDLMKGNEENVEFDIVAENMKKEPLPYYGLSIAAPKFPFLNTYICIAFADDLELSSIYREEFFSTNSEHPLRRKAVHINETKSVTWRLPITLGRRYCLSWAYVAS